MYLSNGNASCLASTNGTLNISCHKLSNLSLNIFAIEGYVLSSFAVCFIFYLSFHSTKWPYSKFRAGYVCRGSVTATIRQTHVRSIKTFTQERGHDLMQQLQRFL